MPAEKNEEKKLKAIALGCIFALVIVLIPLMILGFYDYPTADDWTLGLFLHRAVAQKSGIVGCFKAIFSGVKEYYILGESRFSAAFFGCIVPSAWGSEKLYHIVPFFVLCAIVLCDYIFFNSILKNKIYTLITVSGFVMIKILCVPYPTESFFWYVGAVNYTVINSLFLIFLVLLFNVINSDSKNRVTAALRYFVCVLLAILIGGNNFGTSLIGVSFLLLFTFVLALTDRKKLVKTLPVTFVFLFCVFLSIYGGRNAARLTGEYGEVKIGPLEAIVDSIVHSAKAVLIFTDLKLLFLVIAVIPMVIACIDRNGNLKKYFRLPGVFSVVSFLIYASEVVSNFYIEGGIRGGRMADIYFYNFITIILLNVIYWCGYYVAKKGTGEGNDRFLGFLIKSKMYIFVVFVLAAFCVFGIRDLKHSSSYRAGVWLAKGYAQDYGKQWKDRLTVLNDKNVSIVTFDALDQYTEMVYYADFSTDPDNWFNKACAEYYDKEQVILSE